MTPREFTATEADPRQRLDTLVVHLLEREGISVSRSTVRQWVEKGRVLVDQAKAKPSARVRVDARVWVSPEPPPASELQPDPSIVFNILYEDSHVLVIDKPAGLVVHPSRGHHDKTLVHGLLAKGVFGSSSVEDSADWTSTGRPGIVHRLDKDTSGVMVVACTVEARERLKTLFASHDIEREYLALVVGRAVDATYDTAHGRHPTNRLRFTTRVTRAARRAVTHVRVREVMVQGRASLVSCRLETGRTHQIRVHLAECGATPVLGDVVYGARVRDEQLRRIAKGLGRHCLHAAVLGFEHPVSGKSMRFESPLPSELQGVLEELRGE